MLAQRLVRKLCPHCKRVGRARPLAPGRLRATARTTGYKGRTGVYELMVADDKVRALIHNRAAESQLFVAAEAAGLRSMREDGERLVDEGITSPEEVMRVTRDDEPQRTASLPSRLGAGRLTCPPTFEALDAAGKASSGLLEADNAKAARSQLRAQALVPLAVTPVAGRQRRQSAASRFARRVFNTTALAVWTRQLAGLVGAGPAARARADRAGRRGRGPAPARAGRAPAQRGQRRLALRARAGQRAARVRRGLPRAWSPPASRAARSARCSRRLADDLEERQALRAKLIGATLYPAIVSLIAIVIVIFLVTYVVPQVASVFTSSQARAARPDRGDAGHQRLRAQLGLADAAGLIAAASARFVLLLRNEAFRERFDAAWLNLPLIGRLARGYNAARFAGTLAMLAGAGVPILKALQAAAETLSNRAMRADAMDALVQVREGAPLASALAAQEALPGPAGDVRAPGRADRPAAGDAGAAPPRSSAPRCSAARWRWPPSWSRC